MGYHLTNRLVVRNDSSRRRVDTVAYRLAIDLDLVAKLDALADMGRLIVHGDAPFENELLHLQTRAQSRLSQNLVELGRFHLRQQHTLGWHRLCRFVIRIKAT